MILIFKSANPAWQMKKKNNKAGNWDGDSLGEEKRKKWTGALGHRRTGSLREKDG